jgi:hypothetical protein
MRNLWCLEKISILPLIISPTGIVEQYLFKNLKILDLGNTLVVEIQKGILLYSCHIVRKFLNIDTAQNKTQQSPTCGGETPPIMLISTALLLDSNIRNSVCTPAKLLCLRVMEGNKNINNSLACPHQSESILSAFSRRCIMINELMIGIFVRTYLLTTVMATLNSRIL